MTRLNALPIDALVDRLLIARANEIAAFHARTSIEQMLLSRLAKTNDGEERFQLGKGLELLITTQTHYGADMEKLKELCRQLPDGMRPIRLRTYLDQQFTKHLQNNEVEAWSVIAPAITSQRLKTTLTINPQ
jgi:hypothetical protein